jgi:hypothetical protein
MGDEAREGDQAAVGRHDAGPPPSDRAIPSLTLTSPAGLSPVSKRTTRIRRVLEAAATSASVWTRSERDIEQSLALLLLGYAIVCQRVLTGL